MMTQTIPPVPAAELAVGDRIAEGFLPTGEPAIVLFLDHYSHGGRLWVFVVYRFADGEPYANSFPADRPFPLESRADTGLGYSREPESTVVAPVPADVEGHPEFSPRGDRSVPLIGRTQAELLTGARPSAEPLVHLDFERALTACRLAIIDLPAGHGWTNDHAAVTCKACINELPF